ncbi:hypothetical protein SAMN05216436_11462 [bacterium A37T11]|nr:hypothetical protein SAMN05216436_11462 [bacterium A37T11]
MKNFIKTIFYFFIASTVLMLSNCQDDDGDDSTPPTPIKVMYPITQTRLQQNGGTSVQKFDYDEKNHLIQYSTGETSVRNITAHQVQNITNEYDYKYSGNQSYKYLKMQYITTYSFTLADRTSGSGSVDIYNGMPTKVDTYDVFNYVYLNTSESKVGFSAIFLNNTLNGKPKSENVSGGNSAFFTYNDSLNLKKIEVLEHTGIVGRRTIYQTYDDKFSPFVNVAGIWAATYNQFDNHLALSANNPIDVVTEDWDKSKSAFKIYSRQHFDYEYNEYGYPTKITENLTYYVGAGSSFTTIDTYTYK